MDKYNLFDISRPKQWKTISSENFIIDGKYSVYGANGIIGKTNTYNHSEETILITCRGATCGTINLSEPYSYVNGNAMALDDLDKSKINTKYLFYYLQSYNFSNVITGSAQPQITRDSLKKVEILAPNLETQDKIVAILDKAKNLIDKREQTIKMFDELLRATFLDMFGDPVKNEKGFELRNLTEFYIDPKNGTKCGPFGSALKIEDYTEDGTPVWNMDNISKNMEFNPKPNLFIPNEKFNELQRYNVVNDDIIISRAGTVGKMCVVKTEFQNSILSTNLIRLRLNSDLLLPKYFIYLMKFSKGGIIRLKKGSEDAFSHMNTGILDSITFPYPQISLQNKFHKIYSKIEASIEKLNQSKTQLENLLNGLSQSAFNGELEFNTAVDLEVLLENDYEYFKDNADKKAIQLLLDRLDKNEVNENKFYEEHLYDKAKSFVFKLLKEEKIKQVFDKKTNSIKLTL
jgi:type I restriction enzyme S subunit